VFQREGHRQEKDLAVDAHCCSRNTIRRFTAEAGQLNTKVQTQRGKKEESHSPSTPSIHMALRLVWLW